eukprot:COSAG04_NODE_808_length_10146_cov_19.381905_1_plen_220_part_00
MTAVVGSERGGACLLFRAEGGERFPRALRPHLTTNNPTQTFRSKRPTLRRFHTTQHVRFKTFRSQEFSEAKREQMIIVAAFRANKPTARMVFMPANQRGAGGYRTCAKVMPVYLARTEASVLAGLAAGLRHQKQPTASQHFETRQDGGIPISFDASEQELKADNGSVEGRLPAAGGGGGRLLLLLNQPRDHLVLRPCCHHTTKPHKPLSAIRVSHPCPP